MVRDFTPLAHILGQALGREIKVETDKDFDSFMLRVYNGEFDIVYLNHLQYVQAHQTVGYYAIAKLCESTTCTIAAEIVVRRDGGLTKMGDLRGKTIAFGDRNAMVSHILARYTLQAAGLEANQYHSIFTKNPPNALLAVYNGTAQAAGVGSEVFSRPQIALRVDKKQFRVLARSMPIPQLPLAVRGDLDPQLVKRIRSVLLALPRQAQGKAWLRQINAERFESADDTEYGVVTRLAEEAMNVGH